MKTALQNYSGLLYNSICYTVFLNYLLFFCCFFLLLILKQFASAEY